MPELGMKTYTQPEYDAIIENLSRTYVYQPTALGIENPVSVQTFAARTVSDIAGRLAEEQNANLTRQTLTTVPPGGSAPVQTVEEFVEANLNNFIEQLADEQTAISTKKVAIAKEFAATALQS